MNLDEVTRVRCNRCGHETRHGQRAVYRRTREDDVEDFGRADEHETVEILECLGCEQIIIRITFDHEAYGNAEVFYPPLISRPAPRWKEKIPTTIRAVLEEVYRALQSNSPRLATMGARTIVDLVIVDKIGDVGTFRQKLEALESQGFVGGKNREFLAAALEAGSAAAHRGLALDSGELNHVMDIVENLLEAVYVLEDAAATLRKKTPPRQQGTKT
jgi:hypothetical protein